MGKTFSVVMSHKKNAKHRSSNPPSWNSEWAYIKIKILVKEFSIKNTSIFIYLYFILKKDKDVMLTRLMCSLMVF